MSIVEIIVIGLALSMDAFAVTISNACALRHSSLARQLAMPLTFGLFQGLMPLIGYLVGSFAANLIDQYAGYVALIILGLIGGRMVFSGARALRGAKTHAATHQAKADSGEAATHEDKADSNHIALREARAGSDNAVTHGVGLAAASAPASPGNSAPVLGRPQKTARQRWWIATLLAEALATSIDALIVGVSFLALSVSITIAAPTVAVTTFLCCLVALLLGRRFSALLGDKAEIIGGVVLICIGIKALF
ncbi:MAG: manganese efflux pump MntP family protein [Coriobacteriales bacterium]|nr:manganese efflux pump MntP family protein [Coriobacteriales bacterium]